MHFLMCCHLRKGNSNKVTNHYKTQKPGAESTQFNMTDVVYIMNDPRLDDLTVSDSPEFKHLMKP